MTSIINKHRRQDVCFYPDGRIDISTGVAKMLRLQQGDVIDIGVEGKNEYYLYVRLRADECVGRHVGRVTKANKNTIHNYRANSVAVFNAIHDIVKGERRIIRLQAGTLVNVQNGIEAVPIIIRSPIR